MGFDIFGNRLGYGGGFYDKYLEEIPRHKSVALAFSFQVLSYIPVLPEDAKVGKIVTESGVVDCLGSKGVLQCKP